MAEKSKTFFNGWRVGLIVVFALSVLLYLPTFMGFPIWDDNELINGGAFGTNSFLAAFTRPFQDYYRPLTSASFVFDSSYAKGNPFFYHQTNILLHALTALLVCCLAQLVTKNKLAGILAGVFFLTQPMQVGAAAWIGGRPDVLSALFLVIFMIGLVQYHASANQDQAPDAPSRKGTKNRWLVLSMIAYLLAALSKEQAAAILPAVPISVFALGSRKWRDAWRLCIPFGFVVFVYAAMWFLGGPVPMRAPNGLLDTVVLALKTASHYGLAFFAPNNPSMITFTLENYTGFLWLIVGAGFIAALVFFLRAMWKDHRAIAWITLCGLLVYLPVSNFPTVPSFTVGPFRVADSGTAIACLLGIGAAYAISSKRYMLASVLGANLVAGTIVTWFGMHQWITPEGFFTAVAKNDPHFIQGVLYHAHDLDAKGKYAESVQWTGNTIRWALGADNWEQVLETKKAAAITPEVEQRLRSNGGRPNIGPLGNFIGSHAYSLARMKRPEEAIQVAKGALAVSPGDPWINYMYGELVRKTNRKEAIHYWEIAMKINPGYAACAASLAHERVIDGRFSDAVTLLSGALDQVGYKGNSWLDMADAKIGLRDFVGASAALDKAEHALFAAKPSDVEARRHTIEALSTQTQSRQPRSPGNDQPLLPQ
jgi:hypothetical protein